MTEVLSKMINLAHLATFDVEQALRADDGGRRLSSYAYLYARPQPQLLDQLVETVTTREDKPFGQYWGLQAIERVLGQAGGPRNLARVFDELRRFQREIKPGTDRHSVLARILQAAPTAADLQRRPPES